MREEILINVAPFETRVALLGNGALQEVHLQRAGAASVTGNIYLGRVERILPGMQAAFVDIGLARPGFLHVRDIVWAGADGNIDALLREGQEVLVQVAKDPLASKGARLITSLSIASRYLVLTAYSDHIGVSQRIEDEVERQRLRDSIEAARAAHGVAGNLGFIVRTAAEGCTDQEFATDLEFLLRIWQSIDLARGTARPPALLYEDLPLHIQVLRDLVGRDLAAIRIDCPDTYQRVMRFTERFVPGFSELVRLHDASEPLFDGYLEEEIDRALDPRVPLKCGGYLVVEQTEAMTTIDVNTGGNVGTHSGARGLEETVYRTNLEAAAVIPRQLRLRNLGGIIIVDFIDMEDPEHQRHVLRVLEKGLEHDRVRTRASGFSELGLVEISRKRTRESLGHQLCQPCPACAGRGQLRTAESVCFRIFRDILRESDRLGADDRRAFVVRAAPGVIDRLLDEEAAFVATVRAGIDREIRLTVEPCYTTDQYDVVLIDAGTAGPPT